MVQIIKDGQALGKLSIDNAKIAVGLADRSATLRVVSQTLTTICIETV